jgi:signal transduction histidine kinase
MSSANRPARVVRLALWPLGIAFGAFTFAIVRREPGYSLAGESTARAVAELAAGWALLAVGLIAWGRRPGRRFGALLVAASFGWFLAEWNNPGIASTLAFTLGLTLYAVAPPLVGHAALAYPHGRLSSWLDRVGLAVAYVNAVLVLGLLSALVFDPAAQGCSECPRNLLLIHDSPGLYDWLNRVGVYAGLAWSLTLLALFAFWFVRSTPVRRRLVWPVLAAATVFLGLVAGDFAHSLDRGALGNDQTDRNLWIAEAAALVALALGVVWSWMRDRRTRGSVARLVVDLAESQTLGGLRGLLAETLDDSSLELAYPLADGSLVDARGHRVGLEGEVTPLVRAGREIALLSHSPGLLDDPGLVEEVGAAARLALENERLQAEAQAQLEDLRASRARVIATGDAERRRLERDLHDGAQQRLVGLSLSLRLARSRLGSDPDPVMLARIEEAEGELRGALAELRELAHGIFPAVLADEGLAAALEALAEETPIEITALPDERLDGAVEAAGYFVVSEALRRSAAVALKVGASRRDGLLVIEVEGDSAPDKVVDMEDRVGALDGTLSVVRDASGRVTIRAEIPCES